MVWYDKLYVSEKASNEKIRSLGHMRKTFSFDAYVIIIPVNGNNMLDILSYQELTARDYYKDAFIIGIACGQKDAILLVSDIIWDVYSRTGGFNVRQYFE